MINDNTHKNSLSNIALQLFSITPHAVMPERLFSILDWHHTKRRNRLSPFTLEAIAKIHTFYMNGLNNSDDTADVGYLEDVLDLTDDLLTNSSTIEDKNISSTDATDFIQCVNENHHALREKCEEECIDEEQPSDNQDTSELNSILNIHDRNFQKILIDMGFIDEIAPQLVEDDAMNDDEPVEQEANEDYDVEELLTNSMAI